MFKNISVENTKNLCLKMLMLENISVKNNPPEKPYTQDNIAQIVHLNIMTIHRLILHRGMMVSQIMMLVTKTVANFCPIIINGTIITAWLGDHLFVKFI